MNTTSSFKIAVIGSEYHRFSHCDVIVSRWLEPRPTDALYGWTTPKSRIASMWIEQIHPGKDLSEELCSKHGIPRYQTIAGALTLGGTELAVDAVLLICEHGDYPLNEYHQKLYPRKRFFDEVLAVFAKSGRTVPIFFDKHLSWDTEAISEMYHRIQREKIPFFGGSSLPFQPLKPEIRIPPGSKIKEVVALYYNALESYLFHSMELAQALIEGRQGGETGVLQIIAWQDEAVWEAMDRGEFSYTLLEAAARSVSEDAAQSIKAFVRERGRPVYAFQLTYRDGTKVTHLMQRDIIRKWALAVRLEDGSLEAGCPQSDGEAHFFPHFARLCVEIEKFVLTGVSPIPLQRLFMSSMGTALCMRALTCSGRPYPTPQLSI